MDLNIDVAENWKNNCKLAEMTQLVKIFKSYQFTLVVFLSVSGVILAEILEEWSACTWSLFKMSLRGFSRLKDLTEGWGLIPHPPKYKSWLLIRTHLETDAFYLHCKQLGCLSVRRTLAGKSESADILIVFNRISTILRTQKFWS